MEGQRDIPEEPFSTPVDEQILFGGARAMASLADAAATLRSQLPPCVTKERMVGRRHFRPEEEEHLLAWFARFLTVRTALWEVFAEVSQPTGGKISRVLSTTDWRCFVLGYGVACLIVGLDRCLLEEVATDSLVQRKLNEGSVGHRIPRKQYTEVFESFTDLRKARLIEQAMGYAARHRDLLRAMADDPVVGAQAAKIEDWEKVLDPSRRRFGARMLSFLSHALRRRSASAGQQLLFNTLQASGRVVSELHDHWTPPSITSAQFSHLASLLEPGDVLVTRHHRALTNLFLPGFWPHAALYVGSEEDRVRLGITIDQERRKRWSGDCRVLEALKDGVLYRPLEQTLAVDAVAVIRPQLLSHEIVEGLARVSRHEGKGYNFDFDFFRSDRLVCTEVVYRAFDGLGPIRIPLRQRSGRPTLAAEDLLDLALDGCGFEPIAVAGVGSPEGEVVHGAEAANVIAASYR